MAKPMVPWYLAALDRATQRHRTAPVAPQQIHVQRMACAIAIPAAYTDGDVQIPRSTRQNVQGSAVRWMELTLVRNAIALFARLSQHTQVHNPGLAVLTTVA